LVKIMDVVEDVCRRLGLETDSEVLGVFRTQSLSLIEEDDEEDGKGK